VNAPGFWEIVFLAILALLIFGPERLPGIARTVGRTIGQFKAEAAGTLDELKRSADLDEFKGIAEEFKSTTADLKRSTDLSGPIASPARPRDGGRSTVKAEGPVPFDPDAT
jgi:sec-independent protein translocase protein TatB